MENQKEDPSPSALPPHLQLDTIAANGQVLLVSWPPRRLSPAMALQFAAALVGAVLELDPSASFPEALEAEQARRATRETNEKARKDRQREKRHGLELVRAQRAEARAQNREAERISTFGRMVQPGSVPR